MTFHRCDICGKEMSNKYVCKDTDPLDYYWGEFSMEISIGFQDVYQLGFEDVCHECARKIQKINVDDFKMFFIEKFME